PEWQDEPEARPNFPETGADPRLDHELQIRRLRGARLELDGIDQAGREPRVHARPELRLLEDVHREPDERHVADRDRVQVEGAGRKAGRILKAAADVDPEDELRPSVELEPLHLVAEADAEQYGQPLGLIELGPEQAMGRVGEGIDPCLTR